MTKKRKIKALKKRLKKAGIAGVLFPIFLFTPKEWDLLRGINAEDK